MPDPYNLQGLLWRAVKLPIFREVIRKDFAVSSSSLAIARVCSSKTELFVAVKYNAKQIENVTSQASAFEYGLPSTFANVIPPLPPIHRLGVGLSPTAHPDCLCLLFIC